MEFIIAIIVLLIAIIIYGKQTRKKIYKNVDRLESWKIQIMNRPVTDEMTRVKTLNMVGQTEELFEKWRNQWDEIVTTELPDVEEELFDIEECADKYQFRKAKTLTNELEIKLQKIEDTIQTILQELQDLVGSEEKNRSEIEDLRQLYRDVKRSLLAHSSTFGKAAPQMEKLLDETILIFANYDEAMELGNVLTARELILSIKEKLQFIQGLIEEVPHILKECQIFIPNQIDELNVGIKEMKEEGYVLSHLLLDKEIQFIHNKLNGFLIQAENADIDGVIDGIAEIKEKIDGIYDNLEKEVIAKHFIHKERSGVHEALDKLFEDSRLTKIESEQVQLSYQLSKADMETQANIEKQINELIKRFKNVQASVDENDMAYSLVKIELEEIKQQIEAMKLSHNEFSEMLQTLRKDELFAKEKLDEMRRLITDSKRLVQKSNLPGLPESYLIKIKDCNQSVKMVSEKLMEKPLHVSALNEMLDRAIQEVSRLTAHTEEMVEQAFLVEQVIQYGNRYRGTYYQLAEKLTQAEVSFRNFDYSLALEQAATAIEKVEPGALKKVQFLIENNINS